MLYYVVKEAWYRISLHFYPTTIQLSSLSFPHEYSTFSLLIVGLEGLLLLLVLCLVAVVLRAGEITDRLGSDKERREVVEPTLELRPLPGDWRSKVSRKLNWPLCSLVVAVTSCSKRNIEDINTRIYMYTVHHIAYFVSSIQ